MPGVIPPPDASPLLTLAQAIGPSPEAVPVLPTPPAIDVWIFEEPLRLVLVLAVVGIAALLVLLRLGRKKSAAGALLTTALAAGGAIAAGELVTTDRERLQERTALLVQATARADGPAMARLLDPNVRLRPGNAKFIPSLDGRDVLISGAEQVPRAIGRIVALETRAGLDGPRVARTQARLRAYGTGDQLLGHSWWGLDWQERDGDWIVVEIAPLWIQGAR